MLKRFAILVSALALFVLQSQSAFACGGLVAPDGDIRLARATTLVAWHNGIEHYMTSFTYQENNAHSVANLGWIVPLPAVPLKIEEGGAWTLQRLFRETHPIPPDVRFAALNQAAVASDGVQVLQQVQVEALDITVVKGSGQAVLNWATGNGFALDGDTRAHLLGYAKGSPIFMAAKYDTSRAQARHQLQGDGAPVLITLKVPHPWVPLEVLALDGQQVQADIYLLTDQPIYVSDFSAKVGQSSVGSDIPGATGFKLAFQEKLNATLFHDLSTDRNMSWVRSNAWLTYLSLDAPDTTVTYDMGITPNGVIRLAPFGTAPMAVVDGQTSRELSAWLPNLPIGTPQIAQVLSLLLGITLALYLFFKVRTRSKLHG